MQYHLNVLRKAQRLALMAAVSALAAAGLTISTTKVALAEFEIQESQVEKGEVEIEYRGAVHWGFPRAEREEAGRARKAAPWRKKRKANSSGKATILNSSGALPTAGCCQPLLARMNRSTSASM